MDPPLPSTVQPGNQFVLSWTSMGVTACTASGGSGSDGWSGTQPVSGSKTLTAPATPGAYNYTLTCAGSAAAASATATENVSGTATGVPVFTKAFTITPSLNAAGGTSHFTWAVTGANSCAAVGGTSTDGWSGTEPATSPSPNGVAVTAPASPGVYTYGLICYGSAGSTAQTATISVGTTTGGPTFSAPFTATPSAVTNATPVSFSWASDATSCAAAGGDGNATTWTGVQPASSPSGGVSVTAPSANGAWTYLLGCNGNTGTTIKQVTVTVGGQDCNIPGISTRALLAPHAAVTSATGGALCLDCSVTNQQNVIDVDPTSFATINTTVALLSDSESITVSNDSPFPAGRTAGFIVSTPAQLLTLELLQNVSVSTFLKGAPQETGAATATAPLRLDLLQLGLIGTANASYLSFHTSKDFDAVQVTDSPLVGVLGTVNVYRACVSTQ